jgi:hypothetical protein
MRELLAIRLGDAVEMRKPHACGANTWTVVRTGADIRVSCDQCGRAVLMPRARFVKAVRRITPAEPPHSDGEASEGPGT